MQTLNLIANAIIFAGAIWALLTNKVPTRTGAGLVLFVINFAALGNMVSPWACHSDPEIALNIAVAMGVIWAFWRLELRHIVHRRFG